MTQTSRTLLRRKCHAVQVGNHVVGADAPIVVQSTLFMAQAIILEAALSFLGLGQQPPSPSWGQMLNVAKNFMEQAPWTTGRTGSSCTRS